MIVFKSITLKNFFSVGNDGLTIMLDGPSPILVSGGNGVGKSASIVDSICWVLFNKPYRKVTKPEITNNINEKNCLVQISFDIGVDQYQVHRGIKPNLFEIFKNGTLVDQSDNNRDYQKYLEENILRLNFDSFKQVVILSSSSFVPFMELDTPKRRTVVEDILDIEVFTKMNLLLKKQFAENNALLHQTDVDMIYTTSTINNTEKMIEAIDSDNQTNISDREKKIVDANSKIEELRAGVSNKASVVEKANETLLYKKTTANQLYAISINNEKAISASIKKLETEIARTKEWLICATCNQSISEDQRTLILTDLEIELAAEKEKLIKCKEEIDKQRNLLVKLIPIEEAITKDMKEVNLVKTEISSLERLVTSYQDDIKKWKASSALNKNVGSLKQILQDAAKKYEEESSVYNSHLEVKQYQQIMLKMLEDSGIKSKAISQYIPIINARVNEYLKTLDFFASFSIDENFEETIKLLHRNKQTYGSLSQGQKQRINLALLFTWRDVAKLKNSINTNLLILDETFDSSLDGEGIDNLLAILEMIRKDTNIFVISHRGALLEDRISEHMIFEMKKNFTTMRRVNQ